MKTDYNRFAITETDYNKFIQTFSHSIRSDIKKVQHKKSEMTLRTEIILELDDGWSIGITNWSDGYSVIVYKPNCHILINKWPLSFEEAQKMVREWRVK